MIFEQNNSKTVEQPVPRIPAVLNQNLCYTLQRKERNLYYAKIFNY